LIDLLVKQGLSGARMFVAALQWAHNTNQSTEDEEDRTRNGSGGAAAAAAMDTDEKVRTHPNLLRAKQ
jgi:hypothetical protein